MEEPKSFGLITSLSDDRVERRAIVDEGGAIVAFTVAYNQNKQLIREKGLTHCEDYLRSVKRYVGGKIG
ncbi:lipase maturation factor 1 [Tachysurus ichikawai]